MTDARGTWLARARVLDLVPRGVGGAGVMEFFDLMVGLVCGFVFGCLLTVWWFLPDEMDRR